jgi:hypothetical protein
MFAGRLGVTISMEAAVLDGSELGGLRGWTREVKKLVNK